MSVSRTPLLLALLLLPATAGADEDARALQEAVRQAVARARPSVASVLVSRSDEYVKAPYWGQPVSGDAHGHLGRFDRAAAVARVPETARRRASILAAIDAHDLSDPATVPESFGSGFAVGPDLILTNAHVVRGATRVYVRLPGENRGSWADVHASDPRSDLAVLRLLDPVPGVLPVRLGKGEAVKIGQVLLPLVNPWAPAFRDAGPTVSWGVVTRQRLRTKPQTSEIERAADRVKPLERHGILFQVDARAAPGCSGGVLLDLDGEAVGLTTALPGVVGVGPGGILAIPFDANTRRIIEVLERGEEVEYGLLGVHLDNPDLRFLHPGFGPAPAPPGRGVRISEVWKGSPAGRAGLEKGDLITRVNGTPIRDNDDLFLAVGMSLAGNTVRVEALRPLQTSPLTFSVKLAKFYVPGPVVASRQPPARGGLRVDHTSVLSQRQAFSVWGQGPPDGVLIREVLPGSAADRANLQPDKIVTRVNGRPVASPADYYREMAAAGDRAELTFLDSEGKPERVTLDLK